MIVIGKKNEESIIKNVKKEKIGSIVSYFGYVREVSHGKKVRGMICREKGDSKKIMEKIEKEIKEKFDIIDVVIYHSLGTLKVGELVAGVVVSSVHREDGFKACKYGIDQIKEIEPVRREEIYE